MILETRARYFGGADNIQVAILLQEDDYTSAAPSLKTGTVQILQGSSVAFAEQFTAEHKVLRYDGDVNYDVGEDKGEFYFFVHHPQAQQNLSAKISVEMGDGRTATQTVPIDAQVSDPEEWQNPQLSGHDPVEFPKDTDFPYRPLE